MSVLDADACDMLRRIARRTFDDAKGAFVLHGHGINTARQLVRLGLAIETETWKGKRASAYFKITGLGLEALGLKPC